MDKSVSFDEDKPVPISDTALCDGCGKCVEACPTKTLAMVNDKAVVAHPEDCMYTGLCEQVCPVRAISRPFLIVSQDVTKRGEKNMDKETYQNRIAKCSEHMRHLVIDVLLLTKLFNMFYLTGD